jgi:hypothetical protein
MRDTAVRMRARASLLTIVIALGTSACGGGGGSRAASRPAPPIPINLSAYVSDTQVRISPARFGAGPVLLTVTNQARRSVTIRILTGAHLLSASVPIRPQGVTQLKLDLTQGDYAVLAAPASPRTEAQRSLPARIAAAHLRVGRTRASGGSSLLQP